MRAQRAWLDATMVAMMIAMTIACVAFAIAPAAARSAEPDPALLAEQTRLESGADLSSRAQRVLLRARNQQDGGQFAEAAATMQAWLDGGSERDHHLLRLNLALSHFGLSDPQAALAALERAVVLAPRYGRAWLRLGEAAHAAADPARAGEAFARAYELSPERTPEILYYAGVSQLGAGRAAQALDSLARLVEAEPERIEPDWYRALAAAAAAAELPNRAEPHLRRLLAARPDDPEVWDLAYRFHAGQQKYEIAAAELTMVGYLRDLTRAERVQLGDLYAAVDVPLQAARAYEEAYASGPVPTPDEYRRLAGAWLAAHETGKARATLQKALAAVPTSALWAMLGDVEYGAEQHGPALEAYEKAVALDDGFGRGHLMLAYCALELERLDEARRHLARAGTFSDQREAARALLAQMEAR